MTTRTDANGREGSSGWLLGAIRTDLRRLHDGWMRLLFRRHRSDPHPVLGSWKPSSGGRLLGYRLWSVLGMPLVVLLYPVALAGFAIRYYARGIDRYAARVGLLGVLLTLIVVWGGLTVGAYFRGISTDGLIAVAAAGGVATVSGVLARLFSKWDGRPVTVLLAYPFGVTAVFLPPVVAALYSETLASVVFSRSDVLAIWILDSLLAFGGLNTYLRETFELVGIAYVGMWFGIAIPVGWALGLVVSLADLVRPSDDDSSEASGVSV
ncbi:MAG: hypothetical protein ACOCY7_04305 [Halodesulfurarchaeum sp.]